jgi:hypothetical protein
MTYCSKGVSPNGETPPESESGKQIIQLFGLTLGVGISGAAITAVIMSILFVAVCFVVIFGSFLVSALFAF